MEYFAVIKLFYTQNTMYSFKVKNNVANGHSTLKERYMGKSFSFTLTMSKAFGKNRQVKNYKIHLLLYV